MQPARFHLYSAAIALVALFVPTMTPRLAAQAAPRTFVMGGGYLLSSDRISTGSRTTFDDSSPSGHGEGGWGTLGVQLPTHLMKTLDARFDLSYALFQPVLSTNDDFGFRFTDGADLPDGFMPLLSVYRLKFDQWELAATGSFVWSPWHYCSVILGGSIGLQHVYNISEEVEYSGYYLYGPTDYEGRSSISVLSRRRPSSLENETSLLFGTRIGFSTMIATGKGVRIAPEIDIRLSLLSPFTSRAWRSGEIRAGASLLFDADVDR